MPSPNEHVSESGEVTMLNVVNFSHAPGIGPPSHFLIVHLNHRVATHHRKGDGLLGKGGGEEGVSE